VIGKPSTNVPSHRKLITHPDICLKDFDFSSQENGSPAALGITQANTRRELRQLSLAQGSWCGEKAGLCLLEWRNLVCGVICGVTIMIGPASLWAQTTGGALLYSEGGTWLNGNPAPDTSAIFPDAVIQTQKGHTAKIDANGSTVMIQPETIVQFEGDELVLDHGWLQLNTARQMKVRINCVTVVPLTPDRTQYDVTDIDGKIKVVAYKNDVKIHSTATRRSKQSVSSDFIVHEGEQSTRGDQCGVTVRPSEVVDAKGAILNSRWAKSAAGVVVGTLICLGLCHNDDPVSPSKP